jgi:hypothetical protein
MAALLIAGCVSLGEATPAPTDTPESTPTRAPTDLLEPTGTPDPNASPTFDARALLNAQITIFNLSDFELSVAAVILGVEEDGGDAEVAEFTLAPEGANTRALIGGDDDPIAYRVEFTYATGTSAIGGTCTLKVLAGDDYTFVAVNEGLTIRREGETPASSDELFIDTSTLCRPLPVPPEAT